MKSKIISTVHTQIYSECVAVKIFSCFAILFHMIAGREPIDEQVAKKNINKLNICCHHVMNFQLVNMFLGVEHEIVCSVESVFQLYRQCNFYCLHAYILCF